MQSHARHLSALAGVVLALAACDEDPIRPGDDDDGDVPLAAVSTATVQEDGPIFRSLTVALDDTGSVEVFYSPVDGGPVLRIRSDASVAAHELTLGRLRPSTEYEYAVRAFRGATPGDSIVRGTFATAALPSELGEFAYEVSGSATFPLIIVPFRSTNAGWAGQVAIDTDDGAIVWYVESVGGTLVAAPVPGTNDMVFIENGFPSDGGRNGIARISPERELVALLERGSGDFGQIHHDMTAVDERHVLFLAYETMTVRDTVVTGEAIWEWDMETGDVEKKWSSWDFIDWDTERDPDASPNSWLHANSISVGPRGNVVVSFRTISQVISIAPDFQSLEWRVGGPGATHALAPDDVFLAQHSAWEVEDGRVLLFDNRGAGPDDVESRALELQLGADSAWAVWQHAPGISAPLRGGVYRLESGNTVTIFPALSFAIHETTPAGDVVWEMTGDATFTSIFRAVPWHTIAGEVEVEAMP